MFRHFGYPQFGRLTFGALVFGVIVAQLPVAAVAQAPAAAEAQEQTDQEARFAQFESLLKGVKLVGQFTIVGRDRPPSKEEYTIRSVQHLQGDTWLFNARIKYGDKDVTLPLPLSVKWAGDTPIITLTNFTIPVMGTFSSRVVLYNNKYAGTWTHGEVGGHLFGVIEKIDATAPGEESDAGGD